MNRLILDFYQTLCHLKTYQMSSYEHDTRHTNSWLGGEIGWLKSGIGRVSKSSQKRGVLEGV